MLLLILAIVVGYVYINVNQPITIDSKQLITIEKGTSFSSFTSRLVEMGIIDNRFALRNYVRVNPELSAIKSGTFEIVPGISQKELLMTLVKGKEHQFTITLVEGNTLKQWLEHIKQNHELEHTISDTSYANIAKQLGYSKDLIAEALGHEYGNSVTGIYLEQFELSLVDEMTSRIVSTL